MSSNSDFMRAQMAKARPLASSGKVALRRRGADNSAAWQQRRADAQQHSSANNNDCVGVGGDTHLSWRAADLGALDFAQLAEGRGIGAQARLDLHGCTWDDARARLQQFINQCQRQGQRRALIVHGKGRHSADGQPVLKAGLASWLKQHPQVIAYCSARINDGGSGALYVEFRR